MQIMQGLPSRGPTLTFHLLNHLLKQALWAFAANLQCTVRERQSRLHLLPLSCKLLQLQFILVHLWAIWVTQLPLILQHHGCRGGEDNRLLPLFSSATLSCNLQCTNMKNVCRIGEREIVEISVCYDKYAFMKPQSTVTVFSGTKLKKASPSSWTLSGSAGLLVSCSSAIDKNAFKPTMIQFSRRSWEWKLCCRQVIPSVSSTTVSRVDCTSDSCSFWLLKWNEERNQKAKAQATQTQTAQTACCIPTYKTCFSSFSLFLTASSTTSLFVL